MMLAGLDAFLSEAFYDGLAKAGFPALLLAIAVWWFRGEQVRLVAKLDEMYQGRLADTQTMYGARITDLERRSEACEKDRDDMRKMIWNHLEGQAMDCKTCTHFNPKAPKPITTK